MCAQLENWEELTGEIGNEELATAAGQEAANHGELTTDESAVRI